MNQSLAKKLIVTLLLVGLVPMIVTSFLASRFATDELKYAKLDKLQAVREMKGASIERYFDRIERQVVNLAEMRETASAMKAFNRTFFNMPERDGFENDEQIAEIKTALASYYTDEFLEEYKNRNEGKAIDIAPLIDGLSNEAVVAQYQYIKNNTNPLGEMHLLDRADGKASYHNMHARYHADFKNFLEYFGFYDIFLVEPDNGTIVYSVFKELDYGTSLVDGPYADTNFASAFNQAKNLPEGQYSLKDFTTYRPSYDAPASFIASPIYDRGSVIGVLVFQVPLETINGIMTQRDGMGETGDSYLVGEDLLMRSDSYLSPDDHSVLQSFLHPERGSVNTEATQRAFGGEVGIDTITSYKGKPVLSAFKTINLTEDIQWAVIAEISQEEAYSGVAHLNILLCIVAAIGIGLIIGFAIFISKLLTKPILDLAKGIQSVQSSGDFTLSIDNEFTDEVGDTSRAFNRFVNDLAEAVNDTNHSLQKVSEGNFEEKITQTYPGQLGVLAKGVNSAIEDIQAANVEQQKQAQIAEENAKNAEQAAEQAEKQARSILLIKNALDSSATSTLIADQNLNIVYANTSFKNLVQKSGKDFENAVAGFNSENYIGQGAKMFYINESNQQSFLEGLTDTHTGEVQYDSTTLTMTTTPIIENGQRVGLVLEWVDRTVEVSVEKDIDYIISRAAEGDFNQKIDLSDKENFFLTVSEGLNQVIGTTNIVVNDLLRVFGALANGDLSERIDRDYDGSFGQLKDDVNSTVEKLKEVIEEISVSSDTIAQGSDEISKGNHDLSSRTESQAATLEESAASMEEILQIVRSSEDNASKANNLARRTSAKAQDGNQSVQETIKAMQNISSSSNEIANIISVIDDIAFQTNLLALNAAVEAARAGEQGRGFAVVASEVRSLAQRSATAAKEIKDLITDSVNKVNEGSQLVEKSGTSLAEIVKEVEEVSTLISDIANSAKEQTQGITQVNEAIVQLDSITQQNAALVEEAAAASSNMSEQAVDMTRQVSFFRS